MLQIYPCIQVLIDCLMYEDDNLMAAALHLLDCKYGQRRRLCAALHDVTLLATPSLPIYGHVHALRADLDELVYLVRTASLWGAKSEVSGPFDDRKFGKLMVTCDKLLAFLHTPRSAVGQVYKEPGPECFMDYFEETGLDGQTYKCSKVWSVDVAREWAPRLVKNYAAVAGGNGGGDRKGGRLGLAAATAGGIEAHHQAIVHACSLGALLREAILLGPNQVAGKGAMCTDRERLESERRLNLAKRALLCCCWAFVEDSAQNQKLLFESLGDLEKLVTPPWLESSLQSANHHDEQAREAVKAAKSHRAVSPFKKYTASRKSASRRVSCETSAIKKTYDAEISDLALNLILAVFRGNQNLCERVPGKMVSLFAMIANNALDVSTSPALELMFIICQPEVQISLL